MKSVSIVVLSLMAVLFGFGPVHIGAQNIYWTDVEKGEIRRAEMNGGNVEVLYTAVNLPYFFELDEEGGRIYWAENDNTLVHVSDIDGSGHIMTMDIGAARIRDVDLDIADDVIYWSDRESHTIHRCRLDGTGAEVLFDLGDGLIRPHGTALDTASGTIYWADTIGHSINRGPMDGNGPVEKLYSEDLVDPWDIELDLQERKIYWVERGGARICRGDMDGSGPREVILSSADGLGRPQGLGLDVAHGKMYWADSENQTIQRASLDGSAIENLVTTGLAYPADLELALTRELVSRHHGTPVHPDMPPQIE